MTSFRLIVQIFDRFRRDDDGQGLAEYALILALIAIVSIVALLFLGSQISDKLSIVGSDSIQSLSVTRDPVSRPAEHRSAGLRLSGNQPCSLPCSTLDFLPILPNGPSPLV